MLHHKMTNGTEETKRLHIIVIVSKYKARKSFGVAKRSISIEIGSSAILHADKLDLVEDYLLCSYDYNNILVLSEGSQIICSQSSNE